MTQNIDSGVSMRSFKQYLLLFSKGLAMGAADVVPGVSGGTIAFVSGIYMELIDSIKSLNLQALRVLRYQGFAALWRHINGNFLVTLLSGILTSLFSLAVFMQ
jgi:putative membrane protein